MPAPAPRERPFGVTLLAILYFLEGLIFLAVPLLWEMAMDMMPIEVDILSDVGLCVWIVFIVIALIYFLIALGLLKGMGWARIVAIIFAIIGLLNIPIGTIISIIILIYLFKPEVKAWFQ
jgi:hypothetical protein